MVSRCNGTDQNEFAGVQERRHPAQHGEALGQRRWKLAFVAAVDDQVRGCIVLQTLGHRGGRWQLLYLCACVKEKAGRYCAKAGPVSGSGLLCTRVISDLAPRDWLMRSAPTAAQKLTNRHEQTASVATA